MKVVALVCIATLSSVTAAAESRVQTELQTLRTEILPYASDEMLHDLSEPSLLPADGVHRADVFWDTRLTDIAGGGLALVEPTAVRVGRELLALEERHVPFTASFTVRRLMNAAESWTQHSSTPAFLAGIRSLDSAVRQEAQRRGEPADSQLVQELLLTPAWSSAISISEISPDEPAGTLATGEPGPGEMICYQLYHFVGHFTPDQVPCRGDGDTCWIPICCPPCKELVGVHAD